MRLTRTLPLAAAMLMLLGTNAYAQSSSGITSSADTGGMSSSLIYTLPSSAMTSDALSSSATTSMANTQSSDLDSSSVSSDGMSSSAGEFSQDLMDDQQTRSFLTSFFSMYHHLIIRLQVLESQLTAMMDNHQTLTYAVTMSASDITPTPNSPALGTGYFTLTNNSLYYNVTVTGLTGPISAAHFHRGAPGVSGPAVRGITFVNGHSEGIWSDLTQDQLSDLKNGMLYLNVHTANYPDGEVRGQVLMAGNGANASSVSSSSTSSSPSSQSSSMMSSSVMTSSNGLSVSSEQGTVSSGMMSSGMSSSVAGTQQSSQASLASSESSMSAGNTNASLSGGASSASSAESMASSIASSATTTSSQPMSSAASM